eukprot:TRINITY_DN32062_c0_g1_i1.p1 TRINITY_DN32062_c0_g1~~TRINITY_DN32062_c0_g1_i1.p1  ORF type:complete len:103 (+),score=12.30 TRINITY_DN32062_c0_g1_i1:307-615(+)
MNHPAVRKFNKTAVCGPPQFVCFSKRTKCVIQRRYKFFSDEMPSVKFTGHGNSCVLAQILKRRTWQFAHSPGVELNIGSQASSFIGITRRYSPHCCQDCRAE